MPDENNNPITFGHIKDCLQQMILEKIDYPALTIYKNAKELISGTFETEDNKIVKFYMEII